MNSTLEQNSSSSITTVFQNGTIIHTCITSQIFGDQDPDLLAQQIIGKKLNIHGMLCTIQNVFRHPNHNGGTNLYVILGDTQQPKRAI